MSRDSILSSPDFFGTNHVSLSMREPSLDAYLSKKQSSYVSWRNEFEGYFAGAEDVINRLRLPIRPRTSKIAESIEALWNENAQNDGVCSFRHMVNVFSEPSIQNGVFEAVRTVPNSLRGLPFIWQNVCSILDSNEPRWKQAVAFPAMLRAFLLRCYFDSLCEPGDALVAFSDFHICVADRTISHPTIPLSPLREFLGAVRLIGPLREMNADQILPIISHSACHEFRCRYFEVLRTFRDSAGDVLIASDEIRAWPCNRVVHWFNAFRGWLCRAFGMAGREAGRKWDRWTLTALLDDAAAKGFIKFVEATADSYRSEMRALRAQSEMELRSNRTMVQILNVNANIHGDLNVAPNAGVVGRNASGNTVNQSFDQRAINLPDLAKELSQLRVAMKQQALGPEHDAAVGQVALAEIEAKSGNTSKALAHLKSAGQWAFDQATKIGVTTASAAIKHALGI